MKLFAKNLVAPDAPYKCELAQFEIRTAPFLLAAIEYRIAKYVWTGESRYRAEQLLREAQLSILSGCMEELIRSNNRIYMLLDQTLNGQQYEAQSTDPLVIVPPIPVVPPPNFNAGGVIRQIADLKSLLDNGINGAVNATYLDERGIRQRLDEIKELIGGEGLSTEEKIQLFSKLAQILAALA